MIFVNCIQMKIVTFVLWFGLTNFSFANDINNWLCNEMLWSSNYNNSWRYSNCSFSSFNSYQGTILWLGDNYPQSLSWKNYRITAIFNFIDGLDTGIIFRVQDSNAIMSQGKKYTLHVFPSSISLIQSRGTSYSALYSQFSGQNHFLNKITNITIDVINNRFTFFVDDKFIFEYIDNCNSYYNSIGSIGIRSYFATANYDFVSIDLEANNILPQQYNMLSAMEQIALISLYNLSHGYNWYNKWNLNDISATTACTNLCGITCNNILNETYVTAIALSGNNLYGFITQHVQSFTLLRCIDLGFNYLFGEIPNVFHKLLNLNRIGLSHNQLDSTIPNSLRYLKKLGVLILSYNKMEGEINILSDLTSIMVLDINDNNFSNSISSKLCNLNNLLQFNSRNNFRLNGTISDCIGNWSELRELEISNHSITGTIPLSLCHLTKINKLEISSMKLTSSIPNCIGNLQNIDTLILYDNELNSSIPTSICKLYQMKNLILSANNLIGTVPNCIWNNLTKLNTIYLNNNLKIKKDFSWYNCGSFI
eukprot:537194_1